MPQPPNDQPAPAADTWQAPPIKRRTLVTAITVILTTLVGLMGGTTYLGNAAADSDNAARIDSIEQELIDLKLDMRDVKRDLRELRGR